MSHNQHLLDSIISARGGVIEANPLIKQSIIRHSFNILPTFTEIEKNEVNRILSKINPDMSMDLFAFTNILWYSLSDIEEFTDNFTFTTFIHILWISSCVYEDLDDTFRFNIPSPWIGREKSKRPNPSYRAFMYFRDELNVCHPLFEYEKGGQWKINRLSDMIEEAYMLKVLWKVGELTYENWL